MKIIPVWNAIETILKKDELTKDDIKQYIQGVLESGTYTTPVCLIGRHTEISLAVMFLGDATGTRPRMERGTVTIAILGRAYPAQHSTELAILDNIQHNIFTVLNKSANRSLDDTVTNSRVEGVHNDITIGKEYFGFELVLSVKKMEK